jgi:outer membrane protein
MKKLVFPFIVGILLISASFSSAAEKGLSNYSTASLKTAPPVSTDKTVESAISGKFKVGYVDLTKIAETSDVAKVAKAHFESKADRYKAQIETKQKMLEKQKATLEAKLPTYTPEQRTAKIKDYEKKVDELRKMLQKADKEMKPMQEELIREVYGKIEKTSREFGEANGFSVILEKRELLYLGSGIDAQDVTEQIIAELNRK